MANGTHKFDRTEFEARKAAKAELKTPHTPPNSVPDLRERVYNLEKMQGIDSAE